MAKTEPAPQLPEEQVQLSRLKDHPRNYKKHPQAQLDHIAHNIKRDGIWKNVVASKDDFILAGHGVVAAARIAGVRIAPVRRLPYRHDHPRALAIVVADNETAVLGVTDNAALASLLTTIKKADDLLGTGLTNDDLARLLAGNDGGPRQGATDPDAIPKKVKARTKRGDLWLLGDHRLLCGDSSVDADVQRLAAGEKAALMNTDAPYGVDYVGSKLAAAARALSRKSKWEDIENDDLDLKQLRALLDKVLRVAPLAARPAIYLWHPSGAPNEVFRAAMVGRGVLVHRQIIWVKPRFILTPSGMYHWQHEPCFYGWLKGKVPPWYGKKNQSSVWMTGRDEGKAVHPTQKPVELFERAMRNHVAPGGICYEPFSGSGSQLIAGQRLRRRVLAMEISPAYCDVAIARWEAFTEKTARKAT